MKVQLFRPQLSEEAVQAAAQVLRSGWLGLGPKTEAFEAAFASYTGAHWCVGLNSCTAALHCALHVLDLSPGSEVITTPLTFVSTNHAILYVGAKPVFADIEGDTGNLSLASVADRITDRTRAIMLVHYGGYPCDLDEFYSLARERGVQIIEDCAHACGASYKGRRVGSHGDLHAFSFHAVKNLPIGDGGALTVRSKEHYERLRRLRWLGIDKDTFKRSTGDGTLWDYDVTEVGYKYHMNDIEAAIGLEQLRILDEGNARRAAIAGHYREALSKTPGVRLTRDESDRTSSFHLCPILVENRSGLVAKLRQAEIEVNVHYRRNDEYRMYERQDLPNAEYFSQSVLSLPMHLQLTDEQVAYVTDTIASGW
jgi:perosamine synthetase